MSLEEAFVTFTNQNVSRLARAYVKGTRVEESRSREVEQKAGPAVGAAPATSSERLPRHHLPSTPITPSPLASWRLRWRAIDQIAQKRCAKRCTGGRSISRPRSCVLVGVMLVYNTLRSVAESGLEIVTRPFYGAGARCHSLAALYLAGWASVGYRASARPGRIARAVLRANRPGRFGRRPFVGGVGVYILLRTLDRATLCGTRRCYKSPAAPHAPGRASLSLRRS